jgi:ribosome recycling factor
MDLKDAEDRMKKAVEAASHNFNTIRTGRASASLLDRIMVSYYEVPTPLKSLATVTTPDSSTILIQPFDKSVMRDIERAIAESDLGLTPNNDGSTIRLNIPALTQERRKELVKALNTLAEESRVGVRNIRRDVIDSIRKQEKNGELSEDTARDQQDQAQKLTVKYTEQVDRLFAAKEQEIMKV